VRHRDLAGTGEAYRHRAGGGGFYLGDAEQRPSSADVELDRVALHIGQPHWRELGRQRCRGGRLNSRHRDNAGHLYVHNQLRQRQPGGSGLDPGYSRGSAADDHLG
jgi:hypothetical protein